MAFLPQFPTMGAFGERAEKAMLTPLGAASPLWFAFGAAASTAVAYWWFTQLTKAVNVEAFSGLVAAPKTAKVKIEPAPVAVAPEPDLVTIAEASEPEPAAATVELLAEAVVEPAPAPEPEPVRIDDLTRMSGIGPKLSEALAARGVTRFAQIAAWSAEDIGEVDKALSLKGRAVREAWVAQAKRLAAAG